MRTLKLLLLLALFTGFFMSISCKKGDTGPAGPAGPDSVRYSGWITLQTPYVGQDNNNDSVWQQSITASAITSSVLAKSSIMGYVLVPDFITGDSSIVDANLYVTQFFNVGSIDIVSSFDASGVQYRYVIIPGKIATTDASGQVKTYTAKDLASMNYKAVAGLLNISATGSKLK